jgi:hypothetical protein
MGPFIPGMKILEIEDMRKKLSVYLCTRRSADIESIGLNCKTQSWMLRLSLNFKRNSWISTVYIRWGHKS